MKVEKQKKQKDYIDLGITNARLLCHLGIEHTIKLSSGAARIEQGGKNVMTFSSGEVPPKKIWFLGLVKKEVVKSAPYMENEPFLRSLGSENISYIMDSGRIPGTYTGITEIDLNGAYWTAAYQLGYITEKTYRRAFSVDERGELLIKKKVRLIALGALAKRVTVRDYIPDEKEYKYKGTEYDAHCGGVFFHCAKLIGDIMKKCVDVIHAKGFEDNPFLFYWFDAIFVKSEYAPIVQHFFNEHNFESKLIELESVTIEHVSQARKITATLKGGRKKPFFMSGNMDCKIRVEDFIREIKAKKHEKRE